MAAGAASFPHMAEKAREQMVRALEDQTTVTKPEEAESTGGDLERLRTWVQVDALKQGMPIKPKKADS